MKQINSVWRKKETSVSGWLVNQPSAQHITEQCILTIANTCLSFLFDTRQHWQDSEFVPPDLKRKREITALNSPIFLDCAVINTTLQCFDFYQNTTFLEYLFITSRITQTGSPWGVHCVQTHFCFTVRGLHWRNNRQ